MADTKQRIVTPKFRVSFPQLFEAKAYGDKAPKYSVDMLFDKSTDLGPLKSAVKTAIKAKWGDNPPKGLKLPFKDGNDKDLDGYQDTIVVKASSKFPPAMVDQKLQPILKADVLYAGCYARAAITADAWEFTENKMTTRGVRFFLESVQKISEGEPFSKRSNPSDDFDLVDDSSNDSNNYESDDFDDLFN